VIHFTFIKLLLSRSFVNTLLSYFLKIVNKNYSRALFIFIMLH